MLILCFAVLSGTVFLGGLLLAGRARRLAIVHGASGAVGALALGLALRGGALRGPFAWDALGLAGLALLGGLGLAFIWRRGRRPGLVVFLHASAGGLAYLLLAGFVFGR